MEENEKGERVKNLGAINNESSLLFIQEKKNQVSICILNYKQKTRRGVKYLFEIHFLSFSPSLLIYKFVYF